MTKGIDYYAYVGHHDFRVAFQKAANTTDTYYASPRIQHGNLCLGSTQRISIFPEDFRWSASQQGNHLAARWAAVSPITGVLERGNLSHMMNTPSVSTRQFALSYGFYDASQPCEGLPSQHQAYVYLTESQQQWMGRLVKENPTLAQAPFGTFSLPGAHHAGMNTTATLDRYIKKGEFLALTWYLTNLGVPIKANTLMNASCTQKDSFSTMLDLGVRYFDFRPGYCVVGTDSTLYHQNHFVPGARYSDFLEEVLRWLKANPTEIAVVNLNFNGFYTKRMKPSTETLQQHWKQALEATGLAHELTAGNKDDLGTPYQDLLKAGKRLLFLNQHYTAKGNTQEANNAKVLASYCPQASHLPVAEAVLSRLNQVSPLQQHNAHYTLLQLQGNIPKSMNWCNHVTLSKTASPLMATKVQCDKATYAWLMLQGHKFMPRQLMVCLNDFADNALTQQCATLTLQRLAQQFAGASMVA